MKLLLTLRNTFFEEMTEEQALRAEFERDKLKKKLSLVLKILLLFLTALLTSFLLFVITAK
ncbi:hypothetical protein EGI11_12270 [Chryseobacterium sp. H3056]|uniref:Uncharacterized protein n=1 Tax=Kaistella daneshvariae TaxID=2487074 RepID=A0A3N0WTT1_9FLAO|nr:hypothetical protein EGI11_12270 [Kaistella daneshvariae]